MTLGHRRQLAHSGLGEADLQKAEPLCVDFDRIWISRVFFDIDTWISTLRHVIVVFDFIEKTMAVFDQSKGFSTDEA
jgi:hypothetical protein